MSNCSCKTIQYDRQFILQDIDNAIKDLSSLPNQNALLYLKQHISSEIDSFVVENNSKIINRIFKSRQIDPADPCIEQAKQLIYDHVTEVSKTGSILWLNKFYDLQEVKDNKLLMIERHRDRNNTAKFYYDIFSRDHWVWKHCFSFISSENRERRMVSNLKELKSLALNASDKTMITLDTGHVFVQYVSGLTPEQVVRNVTILDILKDKKDREYDF